MAKKPDPTKKLETYRQKRDFSKTPEPGGGEAASIERLYVMQEHHATRHHWDLRLEFGGVLLSWAITKEPPNKKGIRRLAIHVEDHPIEYASFEGIIPKGEYGAGTVAIWDRGMWTPKGDPVQSLKDGKFEFDLVGERLKGRFILVRIEDSESKQEQWLFMKVGETPIRTVERTPAMKPETSLGREAPMPQELAPNLCEVASKVPDGDDWLFEIKWDGYRCMAFVDGGEVRLMSRNGVHYSIPHIEKAIRSLHLESTIVDGELVLFNERGITSFPLLHQTLRSKKLGAIQFILFDLPYYEGRDLRAVRLIDRKDLLRQLLGPEPPAGLLFSDHFTENASAVFAHACASGLEGLIGKKVGSSYKSARTSDWVKIRCDKELDALIVGYTMLSSGDRGIGAILVAIPGPEGSKPVYAGKVGTGFTEAQRRDLLLRLEALRVDSLELDNTDTIPSKGVFYVEPKLVAKVKFLDWTLDGLVRQGRFQGIAETSRKEASPRVAESQVKLTSPDRVVDPKSGSTKKDVFDYYAAVGHRLLPHLANRPLPIIRCPDGISKPCFFQKHLMKGLPDAVKGVVVDEDDKDPYMLVDSIEAILALVQFGMIEAHPWGSSIPELDLPDRLIFDLDPGDDVEWDKVCEAARIVRDQFAGIGLKSFAKLSGGKGIHIVLPIVPELEWAVVKPFCAAMAKALEDAFPKIFVANMAKAKRGGKVFIDYLRNGRGSTAVAPYSLRAKAGLPAAMPICWDELDYARPDQFDIKTAVVEASGEDPWADFFELQQKLTAAVR